MAAALLSLTSLYIFLGVLAALAALGAIVWAVCRCRQDGRAKEVGDSSSAATGGKHEGLLTKKSNDAVVVIDVPHPGEGPGPPPTPSTGAVELCAICKAPLEDTSWGGCRRLRPCRHVYHADCIDLWLQRQRICPVCRALIPVSWAEIMNAMV